MHSVPSTNAFIFDFKAMQASVLAWLALLLVEFPVLECKKRQKFIYKLIANGRNEGRGVKIDDQGQLPLIPQSETGGSTPGSNNGLTHPRYFPRRSPSHFGDQKRPVRTVRPFLQNNQLCKRFNPSKYLRLLQRPSYRLTCGLTQLRPHSTCQRYKYHVRFYSSAKFSNDQIGVLSLPMFQQFCWLRCLVIIAVNFVAASLSVCIVG